MLTRVPATRSLTSMAIRPLPSGAWPVVVKADGRIGIPQGMAKAMPSHVVADLVFPSRSFRLAATARWFNDPRSATGRRGYITVPEDLCEILGSRATGEMRVEPAPDPVRAVLDDVDRSFVLCDVDGAFRCRARVDLGQRGHWSLEFPTWATRGLLVGGWSGATVEVETPGIPVFHSSLRLGIYAGHPKGWMTATPGVGQRGTWVDLVLRKEVGEVEREPVRDGRLYWGAFAPDGVRTVAVGEGRVGFSAHGPVDFTLHRSSPIVPVASFLGAYLAEGQKTGRACSFTSTFPRFAREVMDLFLGFGIPEEAIHVKLVLPEGVAAEPTTSEVGAQLRWPADRISVAAAERHTLVAITVVLRNGLYFQDTVLRALDWVEQHWKDLPGEALMAFALAYLNGDGGIVRAESGSPASLTLSSAREEEVRLVAAILDYCFGWPDSRWPSLGGGDTIRRAISWREVLDLLSVGAFRYSMARARLLTAYEDRLKATKEGQPFYDELVRLRAALGTDDLSALDTKGHKCVPYPLVELGIPVEILVHAWRPQCEVRTLVERATGLLCDEIGARDVLVKHHYLHSYPGGWSLPLVDPEHGGVAVFVIPRQHVCNFLFGRPVRLLELSRLWSLDGSDPNYLSTFLARCIRGIRETRAADALVSYADPEVGHTGTIYQATNWTYMGRTKPSVAWEREGQIYPARFFKSGKRMPADDVIIARGYRRRAVQGKHRYAMPLAEDVRLRLLSRDESGIVRAEDGPSPEVVGRAVEQVVRRMIGEAPTWAAVSQFSHVATETAYHLLGGSDWGWVGVWVRHMGLTYWWLRNKDTGVLVDVLRPWAGEAVDYRVGRAGGVAPSTTGAASGLAQEVMRRALRITAPIESSDV